MDPQLLQQLMAFLQTQPQYTAKGAVKPYSLDEQAKQTNFQQDQVQSLSNPLFAALLGGAQGIDLSAFKDVPDGENSYDVPANPLEPYLQLPDQSDEKKIAVGIASGLSPEQIVAKFSAQGYKNDQNDKALDRVRATANSLFKDQAGYQHAISSVPGYDPSTGQWSAPEGGKYVGGKLVLPKFKRSDIAQVFDKAGLPTPDKTFGQADFGYDGTQQARAADQATQIGGLTTNADQARMAWKALLQKSMPPAGPQLSDRMPGPYPTDVRPPMGPQLSDMVPGDQRSYTHSGQLVGPSRFTPLTPPKKAPAQNVVAPREVVDPKVLAAADAVYGKAISAQRKAERQALDNHNSDVFDQAYAQERTKRTAASGLTPLTLAMLQRSQALRQLGG